MAKQTTPQSSETTNESSVSRRTFLQSVAIASAASGAAAVLPVPAESAPAAGSVPGAAAAAPVATPAAATVPAGLRVLSEEQGRLLTLVLNRLIPAEGQMPGAGDIDITSYIDSALADAAHLRQPILDILDDVRIAGDGVSGCGESLEALLHQIEANRKDAFHTLIQATYTGYYCHPDVLHAIGFVPPGAEADTSETLDASLLEDVITRGPVYRHV